MISTYCGGVTESIWQVVCIELHDVERWNMKAQPHFKDPGRMLAHASLYLWRYWRQYALSAWEDAESILRQAYEAVEAEDRVEFIRALDDRFTERRTIQGA
jgi:hypothetical protein